MRNKPVFLTIAGSDPSGGAGIQADIKTASIIGCYPCSVITVLTAQNSENFISAWPVEVPKIMAQLECVLKDISPDAVKIGLLLSAESIEVIAKLLVEYQVPNIIVDPVFSPTLSDGKDDSEVIRAYTEYLFPIATLVTPNLPELERIEVISGKKMHELCDAYLLKGGHDSRKEITDSLYFYQGGSFFNSELPSSAFPTIHSDHSSLFSHDSLLPMPEEKMELVKLDFKHNRIDSSNTHGSGCILSSAIACNLALGQNLPDAVKSAIHFVSKSIERAANIKIGKGSYGPSLI